MDVGGIPAVSRGEGRRRLLSMTATHHLHHDSPLGPLLLIADDEERLRGVYLPAHDPPPVMPSGPRRGGGVIDDAAAQLDEYFAGTLTTFDLPLATAGPPLHERVWAALRALPYAATATYGQIAAELGLPPRGARAVGTANARNPLAIIVPCHRVVGSSGALTGYAGGLEAKRRLLAHEARVAGHTLV